MYNLLTHSNENFVCINTQVLDVEL